MKTLSKIALLLGSIAIASGCAGDNPTPGDNGNNGGGGGDNAGGGGAPGEGHPDLNPSDDYDYTGAPASYLASTHSCAAINYDNLGGLLASRGVNIANNTALSAGRLYRDGKLALGIPNYDARVREPSALTTAQTSKWYDILIAGAPEIEAAMAAGTVIGCDPQGVGIQMFNGDSCTIEGLACITGQRVTSSALALCNNAITDAASIADGKIIAMASAMAAAHTCE